MKLPILGPLIGGVKFDFETLIDNIDDAEAFWDHWWDGRDLRQIDRPETLSNEEEILHSTADKSTVDLSSNSFLFNDILLKKLESGRLPREVSMSRPRYREELIKIVGGHSCELENPHVIFAAGGYGSGKTSTVGKLSQNGAIGMEQKHMVGVDYFKIYIPEFSLIQAVYDGRSSLTVQRECMDLAERLFRRLVASKRSFIWDSSLSNWEASRQKISLAKSAGYSTEMIAILTPEPVAVIQAMDRARDFMRFPHPEALPKSHRDFRKHLFDYVPLFERVRIFAKERLEEYPVEVAIKESASEQLAIIDQRLLTAALTNR